MRKVKADHSVLIVDDDLDFLELLSLELKQMGEVTTVHDAESAIHQLSHRQFDLVISDWAIATKTAPEVFCFADPIAFSSIPRKVPVIFISGSEKVEATRKLTAMKNFEAVAFILKSLGPPLIGSVAERVLRRQELLNLRVPTRAKCHGFLGQLCT